ncbi:MAG: ribonuclease III [Candidatus Abyssobacteria bacterium SURF_5]|uniref:Ribonuclease 3 n=1 Tax=Abyssobacteria bacterium (strain SURF_5) TaxID=2093360 RepID=A0A3A4NH71_ABYX5|nr:MAG: ribonuclease III [Candidatus Abyssubacteria bacterium SURF_5]
MQPLSSRNLNNSTVMGNDSERRKELKDLEKLLGVHMRRIDLLNQALCHPSYVNELPEERGEHYEKLEFLGDAVLELIISHELYEAYPQYEEGELTKLRAAVVSKPTLAKTAKKIGIDPFIKLGKGEELGGGRKRNSLLADALEALIGAIYLDGGLKMAREFILQHFSDEIERLDKDQQKMDYKSILQEKTQMRFQTLPKYTVVRESGPPHDRTYDVLLTIKDEPYGIGTGRNKKEAQQNAARAALKKMEEQ